MTEKQLIKRQPNIKRCNLHRNCGQPNSVRCGLSLLEVLLALAILGVSLAALGQVLSAGYRNAQQAEMRSQANMICDAKMAELAAGVLGNPSSSGTTAVPYAPEWQYEILVVPADLQGRGRQNGLLQATVTVGRTENTFDNVIVTVTRFLPDPEYDPHALENQ